MDLNLYKKKVLVTGGSKGIGLEVANTFVQEGANVVICSRNKENLDKAAMSLRRISRSGQSVYGISADLTKEYDVSKAIEETVNLLGGLDILINNAGSAPAGKLLDIPEEYWDKALSLKLMGHVKMAKYTLRYFVEQNKGVITNVIGNDGIKNPFWEITGTASNAAGIHVFKALANQYSRYGIRINTINPGPVLTDRWKELIERFSKDHGISAEKANSIFERSVGPGRIADPKEIAKVVVFVSSDVASYINGATIEVDGNQQKDFIAYQIMELEEKK